MRLNTVGCLVLVLAMGAPGIALAVPPNGEPHNGLTARSLFHNALLMNPKALDLLRALPLRDSSFDKGTQPYLNLQLTDPAAMDVMEYLVACALGPSATVHYENPESGARTTWRGLLGVCPSWADGAPSKECRQLASGCLLALTNRLHRHVPVRVVARGVEAPADRVLIDTAYPREDPNTGVGVGDPILAFERGWYPGYVGRCAPGDRVELASPASPGCAEERLRVCEGIHGCYDAGSEGPENAEFLAEQQGVCSSSPLAFVCPESGYYGTMTRASGTRVERVSGGGEYPARARDVFPYLEGAFYGDLLLSASLQRFREMVWKDGRAEQTGGALHGGDSDEDAVPMRTAFGCFSLAQQEDSEEGADLSAAYMNGRICVSPNPAKGCLPNPPLRCHYRNPKVNAEKGAHCKWNDEEGMYEECTGNDGNKYSPFTVYLSDPCDLTDDDRLCASIRAQIPPIEDPPPPIHPGTCVCALGVGSAPGWPLPASAVLCLALHLRRRRRVG